ncbi:MAG: ABC transporter permease [Candidatus Aminicenantes bacterium]|nr:ABC transporter permease [Candidatus Aminicenantes bacterium]
MFEPEKAIREWAAKLRRHEEFDEPLVADLELQLRDTFEQLKKEGLADEEAFHKAVSRMGPPGDIAAEYRKNLSLALDRRRPWRPSRFVPALGGSYLKTAWRKMMRQKGYAFINIAGLAVGLACALFIRLWVQDELGYDRFHANASTLFRVEQDQSGGQGTFHVNVSQYPMGPAIQENIPEIEAAVRMGFTGGLLVRSGDRAFFENRVIAVDPAFLTAFTFPLLRGDRDGALADPRSIVLSEDMAAKYFGSEDPLGKTLVVNGAHSLAVTGVAKKPPANSSLRFDMLVPFEFLRSLGVDIDRWGSNTILTWVELHDPQAAAAVGDKITAFMTELVYDSVRDNPEALARVRSRQLPRYSLRPLTDLRLKAVFGFGQTVGTIDSIRSFTAIALLVLLIACINFMNLATARAAGRAKEVGLRKVAGALRRNIVSQFYGESALTTLLGLIVALVAIAALRPAFNTLAGKEIQLGALLSPPFLLGMAAAVAATAFVAGSYPSLLLSSLRPAGIFRIGSGAAGRSPLLRRVLVMVQFGLSIALLIGTAVVYRQIGFMRGKALGFERDHLIYLPLRGDAASGYPALKAELLRSPLVPYVSGTGQIPTNISANSWGADWEGRDPESRVLVGITQADFDYAEALGVEMAAGRTFRPEFGTDRGGAFLVNEEVARLMGLSPQEAVGKIFRFQGVEGPIIGVAKNYHYKPVQNPLEPMAVVVAPEAVRFAVARLSGGDLPAALRQVEAAWNAVNPRLPYEYRFFDDDFDASYRQYEQMGTILVWFAGLGVFVACLGLFGLASFLAEQRRKEIGVRKVLGASPGQVVGLLSKEFAKWVLLANIVAWPAAYFAVSSWLRDFPFRTNIPPALFVLAGAAALAIALLTVSGQALKAARSNPAEALKYE